jgi:hypothetical protein
LADLGGSGDVAGSWKGEKVSVVAGLKARRLGFFLQSQQN